MHLQTAYNHFFKKPNTGFPKFKSKRKNRNSYTTNNQKGTVTLENGYLKLPKFGTVKVKQHRQIPANYTLKSATISRTPSGKYYASILFEYEHSVEPVKINSTIANFYDLVGVEDLNMRAMGQALNFGKPVADNAWGMFRTFLKYKLEEQGRYFVVIDKWFPSSKTCSKCGYKNEDLTLSVRAWICPHCRTNHDRDVNAAVNIRNEAVRIATA